MRPKWYQNGPRGAKRAEKRRKKRREERTVRSRASEERSGAKSGASGRGGGASRGGGGGGTALLRCEEYYEILKICETVAKIKHVGKRGSVENRRFSRNRLKPINSARGRIVSKLKL